MATLLQIIRAAYERTGRAAPNDVMGSGDKDVIQMRALLEEGLDQLAGRARWERITKEITWTTLGVEDQGDLYGTGLGSGPTALTAFRYWLPGTMWDRSNMRPLCGPVDPDDWQMYKAAVVTGPIYSFRQRGGHLLVTPAPTAGWTWAFEYLTENFIAATGSTLPTKKRFTANTDEILLPDEIVLLDLRWRWKKEKGLAYAEDFDALERALANAAGRDGGKKVLYMHDHEGEVRPGIMVPIGSHPL